MSISHEKEDDSKSIIIRIKPEVDGGRYATIHVSDSISLLISSEKKYLLCNYTLEGYNGYIFAYGQTVSEKTYTLYFIRQKYN